MPAKMKSAVSALSDAIETACGWGLLAVGIYAVMFIDLTGSGSLWSSLHGLSGHARTTVVKVPVQADAGRPDENRFLVVLDEPKQEAPAQASAAASPPAVARPREALIDSPADPAAGKSWKKRLEARLRTFTIYGQGEQTTSASARAQSSFSPPAAAAPAPIVAAAGSAAHARPAAARPGVSTRVTSSPAVRSSSVRNVR